MCSTCRRIAVFHSKHEPHKSLGRVILGPPLLINHYGAMAYVFVALLANLQFGKRPASGNISMLHSYKKLLNANSLS